MGHPHIAVALGDRRSLTRVLDALAGVASVVRCDSSGALLHLVHVAPPAAIVADVRDAIGASRIPVLRTILARVPRLPILVYASVLSREAARDLVDAGRLGVADVLIDDLDDLRVGVRRFVSARLIRQAAALVAGRRLQRLVLRTIPERCIPFFLFCLENAHRPITVADAATALGVHRKTIAARLQQEGLPTATHVIAWSRLIAAAALLTMGEPMSVDRVAADLGFGSGASLRNKFQRYMGIRPTQLRRRDGVRAVVHAFTALARRSRRTPAMLSA